jgi:hypothetical protein|uniref:Uncharacterized protein n=1 Tax=Eutreptiella gymnastica TaxID=73025 RepID=A0A7S4CHK6_9EUGL
MKKVFLIFFLVACLSATVASEKHENAKANMDDWPENQYKAPPGTDTYQIAIWSSIAMVLAAYGAARTVATIDYSGDTLLLCVDDSSAQDN